MYVSNWDKFRLLMWKNWIIQYHRKRELAMQILAPVLFTMLLVIIRGSVRPLPAQPEQRYEPISIDKIRLLSQVQSILRKPTGPTFVKQLAYSPENEYLDKIIKGAAEKFQLTVVALRNAAELKNYMNKNNIFVGVTFNDRWTNLQDYPKKLSFALRFPSELRTGKDGVSWETNNLFPPMHFGGPRNGDKPDGGIPPGYIPEGFTAIQNAISLSFVKCVNKDNNLQPPNIMMQRYPYPAEDELDALLAVMHVFLSLIFMIGFNYSSSCIASYVVTEKEQQLKEVMIILGIDNWLHWAAWFMKSFTLMSISLVIMVIMLKGKWSSPIAVIPNTDWSVLLFFFMVWAAATICFCFMISAFFSKPTLASSAAGIIAFISYLPFSITFKRYSTLTLGQKLSMSLLSNSAMGFGLNVIMQYEASGAGLQWNKLFTPINEDDSLHLGHVIFMMIVSCFIYVMLALYIEQVIPGQYGVPKPWYFPFRKSYWCPEERFDEAMYSLDKRSEDDGFEEEPVGKRVGIQVRGLRKVFDKKVAVHGLSMNMYEDEITVLLGHNGAGKTTTVSMLTGMFPPTSGTAVILGHDIRKNLKRARMSLGLCPQHNILFDDLTVKEHIIFYSRLKGVASRNLGRQIYKYIDLLQLSEKLNTQSQNLSGGMKRKLSVGLALCGDTRVVLLDEPTAGMDPSARRALWELLLQEKNGRTILLLTHFMDEADVLADRIAIMSGGKLMCHGTSFFLKKKYGVGYHLIFEKANGCDSSAVTTLLRKYIPNIKVDTEVGRELSYKIPEQYSNVFERMLAEIESHVDELKIMGYGISVTNLEEVFMAVGRETRRHSNVSLSTVNDADSVRGSIHDLSHRATLLKGQGMIRSQWKAMMMKKYYQIIRNPIFLLVQIIVPIYMVATALADTNASKMTPLRPLLITLNSYQDPVTVLQVAPDTLPSSLNMKIANEYKSMFDKKHALETTKISFQEYILNLAGQDFALVYSKYLVGAAISSGGNIIAWFNNEAYHSAPLALNLIHNAIARATLGSEYGIEVTNNPMPFTADTMKKHGTGDKGGELGLQIGICMAFVTAFYVRPPIMERESKAKLLQFVSGSRIWIYWITSLIMDLINFLIVVLGIIITFLAYQEEGWSTANELLRLYLVFIVFGFSMLPFTYLLSFLFKSPVSGYTGLTLLNLFTGMGLIITISILYNLDDASKATADTLTRYFMLIPHFALTYTIFRISEIGSRRKICDRICTSLPSCKLDMLCQLDKNCCPVDYYQWDKPGIGANLFFMIMSGLVYLLIILIYDYRWIDDIVIKIKESLLPPPPIYESADVDEDVAEEKNRISSMSKDEIAAHNLILDKVTKYYGNYLAVNQISVGVRHSECFGLLGTNGAGKTSTFKILTGDERISRGNAYVCGISLRTDMKTVYQKIGYCPQFDALLEDLTARETINFFALLRGVPQDKIDRIIRDLARKLAFTDHLDKNVRNLSGGNKRKLSTAIAVLGNPSVIYLDEPTSGIDPAARRKLWNVVSRLREMGKSIVLTSHSMEECEALCTRLAIMVNGEFKCIGSTQRLKNKFSKGFVIKVKLKSNMEDPKLLNASVDEESSSESISFLSSSGSGTETDTTIPLNPDAERVKQFIATEFPQAVLKEEYQSLLTFYIPTASIKWSAIFGLFEKNRASLNIEDYSISQTTLEEIFLEFAAHQLDDRLEVLKRIKKNRKGWCSCP